MQATLGAEALFALAPPLSDRSGSRVSPVDTDGAALLLVIGIVSSNHPSPPISQRSSALQ